MNYFLFPYKHINYKIRRQNLNFSNHRNAQDVEYPKDVAQRVYDDHFPIFISVSFPFYVPYLSTPLAHVTSSILQSNHGERTRVIPPYFSGCVASCTELHSWEITSGYCS